MILQILVSAGHAKKDAAPGTCLQSKDYLAPTPIAEVAPTPPFFPATSLTNAATAAALM
jgi:hypothetical protein